ncbi:MAG: protein transport protein bos1 [Cirrosporium novae-zelandiae]|nr:MAG: protein transport protein bos1 [Cirrosporium novae-zelandiae]
MNVLFNTALKQSNSLRRDITTLSAPDTPPAALPALQGQISTTLTSFSRTLSDYSIAIRNEPIPSKQEKAQERLERFRGELDEFKPEFERIKKAKEEERIAQDRGELFGRSGTAGRRRGREATSTPENPYADATLSPTVAQANPLFAHRSGAPPQSLSFGSADPTRESHTLREQSFLSQTGTQIDEFLERGRAVLGDLGQQREVMKGTQKRLYSVGTTLGISGETIRMVERRARQDKWIFWGGVITFLLFCWGVIWLFK